MRTWIVLLWFLPQIAGAFDSQPRVAITAKHVYLLGLAAKGPMKEQAEIRGWANDGNPIGIPNFKDPTAVIAGDRLGGRQREYGCGVDSGKIKCWGPLGSEIEAYFANLNLRDVISLASGLNDICAVDKKRGLHCYAGEIPWTTIALTPKVQDPLLVAVGTFFACVINASNEIACWGGPSPAYSAPLLHPFLVSRMANIKTKLALTPKGLKHPESLTVGLGQGCVLDDGKRICWGEELDGELHFPADTAPVTQVDAGAYRTCEVTLDARVRCAGHGPKIEAISEYPLWFVNQKDDYQDRNRSCLVDVNTISCQWKGGGNLRVEHGLLLNHRFSVEFPKMLRREIDRAAFYAYQWKAPFLQHAATLVSEISGGRERATDPNEQQALLWLLNTIAPVIESIDTEYYEHDILPAFRTALAFYRAENIKNNLDSENETKIQLALSHTAISACRPFLSEESQKRISDLDLLFGQDNDQNADWVDKAKLALRELSSVWTELNLNPETHGFGVFLRMWEGGRG